MKQIDLLESSMLILKLDFNKKKLGVKKGKKKKRLVRGWVGVGVGMATGGPIIARPIYLNHFPYLFHFKN